MQNKFIRRWKVPLMNVSNFDHYMRKTSLIVFKNNFISVIEDDIVNEQ